MQQMADPDRLAGVDFRAFCRNQSVSSDQADEYTALTRCEIFRFDDVQPPTSSIALVDP